MKFKREIKLKLRWNGNVGHYDGEFKDFFISKELKCDFNLVINVVESLTDNNLYDLESIVVNDLMVFDRRTDDYIILNTGQYNNLIKSIQDNVTW